MSQDQAKQYLMQGIQLAQAGKKDEARQYFSAALKLDGRNEAAWLWMSTVARDNREKIFCLQNLLQVNPQNERAIAGLQKLGLDPAKILQATPAAGQSATTPSPAPGAAPSPIPILPAERIQAALASLDPLLRSYQALPQGEIPVDWANKSNGRYGEGLARRRQASRYGALAAALVVVLCLLGGVGLTLLNSLREEAGLAEAFTPTASFTPTFTPTSTPGVTNTPSPTPQQTAIAFTPAPDLSRGSIYGNPPTAIYPPVASGLGREFERAVAEYSIGNYEAALPVFQREREAANALPGGCQPQAYYYEILSLAEQGNLALATNEKIALYGDARQLYEDGLARGGNCEDSPMIWTAACVVDYLWFLADTSNLEFYTRAVGWCDGALDSERLQPPMSLAFSTRARLRLLETPANFAAARATLRQGLEFNPEDLNLILVAARVELASGDIQGMLNLISQALYVDPISEAALRLRVEAFLQLASESSDPDRQTQLYGTAVLWAQEYLLYYPGKPDGYLLLAQARLGENKPELAEEALTRVIEARQSLPDFEQGAVLAAYTQRAALYRNQSRYALALEDVQALLQAEPDNPQFLEQQAEIAYRLGRYSLSLESLDSALASLPADPPRYDLQLRQVELISEICRYTDEVTCDYPRALEILEGGLLEGLSGDAADLAIGYLGVARYQISREDESLNNNQRTRALEQARGELTDALSDQQRPFFLHHQGLILEALADDAQAQRIYNWVVYWAQFYPYPLLEEVQDRLDT